MTESLKHSPLPHVANSYNTRLPFSIIECRNKLSRSSASLATTRGAGNSASLWMSQQFDVGATVLPPVVDLSTGEKRRCAILEVFGRPK